MRTFWPQPSMTINWPSNSQLLRLIVLLLVTAILLSTSSYKRDHFQNPAMWATSVRGDKWQGLEIDVPVPDTPTSGSTSVMFIPATTNTKPSDEDAKSVTDHDTLFHSVRVFCWIMTSPRTRNRANAVKATWAKRCNDYIFISSEEDPSLPAKDALVGEGRDRLWGKTKFGFRYAYHEKTLLNNYDWFMKADDDTFVMVDNLRLLLSNHSSDLPTYFGCEMKPRRSSHASFIVPRVFMSGGAGYVLSREALRRLVERGLDKNICRVDNAGNEDVEMGVCLHKVGVVTVDSRDHLGRGRFFPFPPARHLARGHTESKQDKLWYTYYQKYPEKDLLDCCSETAISFHYINETDMYLLEYLVYRLKLELEERRRD